MGIGNTFRSKPGVSRRQSVQFRTSADLDAGEASIESSANRRWIPITKRSPITIDTISDPDLAALHAYGSGKCNNRAMPSRANINPSEIRLLLPAACTSITGECCLPLSDDGITPNMPLGIQKAIGIDGYKIHVPRWM